MISRAWSLAVLGLAAMTMAGPAFACSPAELVQKQKAYADAVKVAFERDPGGDGTRQTKARQIIEHYSTLKNSSNGGYIIDQICKENDELLAIYK